MFDTGLNTKCSIKPIMQDNLIEEKTILDPSSHAQKILVHEKSYTLKEPILL